MFVVGSERRTYFETESVMALPGHPRSLILAPIESTYATSIFVINSNLGPILPRFRDIAGFLLKTAPHPYSTQILGVFPLDQIADVVAPRSEDHKLIIR